MKILLVPASLPEFDMRDSKISRGIALGFVGMDEGQATISDVLDTIERKPRPAPWGSYWAWCPEHDAHVGLCAFKAPPDSSASVELAYFTFPKLEGRGIASQMVAEQIAIARLRHLRRVTAHTLPVLNASGNILRRLGFDYIGDVIDPEDGLVWAWVHTLAA
jgi:RimJ/RimL family protein N-acetyltransferase